MRPGSVGDVAITLGPDATVTDWSAGAQALYGYTSDAIVGASVSVLEAGAERGRAVREVAGCRGPLGRFASVHAARDGTWFAVEVTLAPQRGPTGELVSVPCLVRDARVGDRSRYELQRVADAAEQSAAAIVSIDREGCIRHWSAGAERVLGVRAQDAVGRGVEMLNGALGVAGDHGDQAREIFELMLGGAPARDRDVRSRRADGSPVEIRDTFLPWREGAGVVGMTVVMVDTTGHEADALATARLAAIAESSADAIIGVDPDGMVTDWNAGAERIFGYAKSEIVGRAVTVLVPDERQAELAAALAQLFAGERALPFETVRRRKDGSLIDVWVSVGPVRNAEGRVTGTGAVIRDLTELKRTRLANARLASIVNSANDAIVSISLDGTITTWNPAAERIYGYPASEAIGRNASMLLPEGQDDELVSLLTAAAEGSASGARYATRRRKDGTFVELAATAAPLTDETGTIVGVASVSRDVTDQRRAQRDRERALSELKEAQRLARVGSWHRDWATGEVTWSDEMYELFGRDPADGPVSGPDLLHYIDSDDLEPLFAEVAARPGDPGLDRDVRLRAQDGVERILHVRSRPDPISPGSFTVTLQDVTAERAAESERASLRDARIAADSASRAKSEFLARMSHELRTPLNAIIGFGQLLELQPLEPVQRESVDYILKGGRHLLALIDEVLDIARVEAGRMTVSSEPVAIEELITETTALLRPQAGENELALISECPGGPELHVMADRNRLKQVLLNLVSNAIKYNRPGGRILVRCTTAASGRIRVAVSDTGIGIGSEYLADLFVPFERLGAAQSQIEGTGLGLTLSKGLVEAMGGTIEVATALGQGSTFTVELAAAEPPDLAAAADGAADMIALVPPAARAHRILYIEDNLSNLSLVQRIIAQAGGAEVIPAMQGGLGLELARDHRPDLILLDLHLPDIEGTEVLKRLHADHPEIPVVVLTADARRSQDDVVRRLGATDCLTKPIDVSRLIALIANVLARRTTDASA
ncbi:MAG: PAS domain S-box protein [Solirubrobacteraceae bacterium]